MNKKIKIAIADNQNLFRSMFAAELKRHPLFDFMGESRNGIELLQLLHKVYCDVVVIDTEMPLMNGVEIISKIKKKFPETLVLILSENSSEYSICECMLSGAKAYMTKRLAH